MTDDGRAELGYEDRIAQPEEKLIIYLTWPEAREPMGVTGRPVMVGGGGFKRLNLLRKVQKGTTVHLSLAHW